MNSIKLRFAGEYANTLDLKNRVNIPAKFRKALDPINDRTFVITRGFDTCLTLYPISEWNIVEQQLASLSSIRNRNREFVRSIVRYASYVQYDRQGRIIIPDNLKVYACIDREVSIIGMISKIELWSPENIKKHDNDQMNIDEFDDLADDISF
jgi:MraZ protein